jgi:hypothetical protein
MCYRSEAKIALLLSFWDETLFLSSVAFSRHVPEGDTKKEKGFQAVPQARWLTSINRVFEIKRFHSISFCRVEYTAFLSFGNESTFLSSDHEVGSPAERDKERKGLQSCVAGSMRLFS